MLATDHISTSDKSRLNACRKLLMLAEQATHTDLNCVSGYYLQINCLVFSSKERYCFQFQASVPPTRQQVRDVTSGAWFFARVLASSERVDLPINQIEGLRRRYFQLANQGLISRDTKIRVAPPTEVHGVVALPPEPEPLTRTRT